MTNITKQVQPCLAEVRNQPDCVGSKKLEINQMLLIRNDLNYYFQISNLQRKYLTTILCLIYKNPQQQQQQQQKEILVEENESLTPIQVKKIARLLKYGGCYCCCCCCSCICRQAQYTSTSSEYNAKKLYCKKLHLTTSNSSIRNTISTTTITNTKRRTRRKRKRRRRRRRSRILSLNKKLLQMNAGKMHSSKTSTGKFSCPCQIQCSVVGYNNTNNTINGGSCSTCSCSWHIWHSSEKYKKQQQQHFLLLTLNNNVGYRCRRFCCRYYMKNFVEYDDDINDVHVDDSVGIRKIMTSHACYQKLFHKNTTMLAPKCLNTTNTTTNTKMYHYNFLNVIAIATSTIKRTITATRYIYIKYIFRKAFKQQQQQQEKEDEKTKVLLKEKKYVKNAEFQKTQIKELPIHVNNVILYYKCKLLTLSSPTIIIMIEKEKEKNNDKKSTRGKIIFNK